MKKEKNNKSKKVKTIVIKDYKNMIVDYLYNNRKIEISNDRIISKKTCYSINHIARIKNYKYFNTVLHKSINYFLKRKNINKEDLRVLLGSTLKREVNIIMDNDNFEKYLDFRLVYDLCQALDIDMKELVERMEAEFTNIS